MIQGQLPEHGCRMDESGPSTSTCTVYILLSIVHVHVVGIRILADLLDLVQQVARVSKATGLMKIDIQLYVCTYSTRSDQQIRQ